MSPATASAAGRAGLVPTPGAGKQNGYLRGDATWVTPTANLLATEPGIPLDQTMGKVLKDDIDALNSKLGKYYPLNKIYALQNQYTADANGTITVTLERPLKDQWYLVFLSDPILMANAAITDKTANGFKVTYAPWANAKPWVGFLCVAQW